MPPGGGQHCGAQAAAGCCRRRLHCGMTQLVECASPRNRSVGVVRAHSPAPGSAAPLRHRHPRWFNLKGERAMRARRGVLWAWGRGTGRLGLSRCRRLPSMETLLDRTRTHCQSVPINQFGNPGGAASTGLTNPARSGGALQHVGHSRCPLPGHTLHQGSPGPSQSLPAPHGSFWGSCQQQCA